MDDKKLDRLLSGVFIAVGVIALSGLGLIAWGVVTLVNWLVTK